MQLKALLLAVVVYVLPALAGNPIITNIYTADPSARVFNDTLYIYPGHDRDQAEWWNIVDWHVFSTTGMANFKDHGVALSLADLTGAEKYAWAPDCVEKNGAVIDSVDDVYDYRFAPRGEAGVCRVVAGLRVAGVRMTWVLSNPIYVFKHHSDAKL